MTDRMHDDQLDRQLRSFLAWQAEDVAGAPTATEVAMRLSAPATTTALGRRMTPQLVWMLLAVLLIATVTAAVYIAAAVRKEPLPSDLSVPSSRVENGWIAFSTQPGFVQ